jgi:ribonucleotide monophosphatase NagD (HAD superfamily)
MFLVAAEMLGADPQHTLMLGDRLDTDIAGANSAGMSSALVLTGVSQRDDVGVEPGNPDMIISGLPELLEAWRAVR